MQKAIVITDPSKQNWSSETLSLEDLKLLGRAVDQSVSPFVIYAASGHIIYANSAMRESWPKLVSALDKGETLSGAIEKQIRKIAPDLPEKVIKQELVKAMSSFTDLERTEMFAENRRWFSTTHTLVDTDRPEASPIAGAAVDITTLKEHEKELKLARKASDQANKSKSEFLANMSHEIRTPMNGILGMAGLLAQSNLSDRDRQFVKVIERSGDALLTLINDILDFSKVEAGQIELEARPFCLRDCVEDIFALLSSAANETAIDLIAKIDPKLPEYFLGDVGRLRQILTNLIGNAIKFTHKGHVLVDIQGVEDHDNSKMQLIIQVQDTGIGIPDNKLNHIFDKFSQVDASTTREYGGTGLGLSIAKRLSELMGGGIQVESIQGQGSTFTVMIVLEEHEVQTAKSIDHNRNPEGTILLVDDNPVNHSVLEAQLAGPACRCISVLSAAKAAAVLKRARGKGLQIDLIILDYQMPIHSGADFVHYIKSQPDFCDIPVILLSSVDKSDLKKDMLKAGVNAVLTKPARMEELFSTINAALRPPENGIQDLQINHHYEIQKPALSGPEIQPIVTPTPDIIEDARVSVAPPDVSDPVTSLEVTNLESERISDETEEDDFSPLTLLAADFFDSPQDVETDEDETELIIENEPVETETETITQTYSLMNVVKTENESDAISKAQDTQDIQEQDTQEPDMTIDLLNILDEPECEHKLDMLVAEDNEVNQMYMNYILEDTGLEYEIASNGLVAVEMWKARKPDVILMDISMPKMNGLEATKKIRDLEEAKGDGKRTVIIAVTAHAMPEDTKKCLDADMDDYLSKPVSAKLLMEKLRHWTKESPSKDKFAAL